MRVRFARARAYGNLATRAKAMRQPLRDGPRSDKTVAQRRGRARGRALTSPPRLEGGGAGGGTFAGSKVPTSAPDEAS